MSYEPNAIGDELYEDLLPLVDTWGDPNGDLQVFCRALGAMAQPVDDIAKDGLNGEPGWSQVLDLGRAKDEWLAWLGQWVGYNVPNKAASETQAAWSARERQRIITRAANRRATVQILREVVGEHVTQAAIRDWVPTDLPGCEICCLPDGLPAIGSSISGWANTGNLGGTLAQATGAFQPIVAANAIDGQSAARFDNVDDFLSMGFPADASRTVYIVAKQTAAGGTHDVWGVQSGWFSLQAVAGAWNHGANLGGSTTNFSAVTVRLNSISSADGYVNGAAAVNTDPNDAYATQTTFYVGQRGNTGAYWNGDVAAVIVYNSAHSDADRLTVLGYLSRRFPSIGSFGTPPNQIVIPAGKVIIQERVGDAHTINVYVFSTEIITSAALAEIAARSQKAIGLIMNFAVLTGANYTLLQASNASYNIVTGKHTNYNSVLTNPGL